MEAFLWLKELQQSLAHNTNIQKIDAESGCNMDVCNYQSELLHVFKGETAAAPTNINKPQFRCQSLPCFRWIRHLIQTVAISTAAWFTLVWNVLHHGISNF